VTSAAGALIVRPLRGGIEQTHLGPRAHPNLSSAHSLIEHGSMQF
jgi:hypothetical protein